MYSATTQKIEVRVRPIFQKMQSPPHAPVYTWAYEIELTNHSEIVVQLMNRYWRIVDSSGLVREVRGAGVIGQNPILNPGEKFTYSSFTQLPTPTGWMEGSYEMLSVNGGRFDVIIPRFILAPPARMVSNQVDVQRKASPNEPSRTLQ